MESQVKKLYNLLSDGKPHNTAEIQRVVYGGNHLGVARISARVADIRAGRGVPATPIKDAEQDKYNKSLYWYQMDVKKDCRNELKRICIKQGCRSADDILKHILCRTGIVFKSPEQVDDKMAEYLLNEFQINKPCCNI